MHSPGISVSVLFWLAPRRLASSKQEKKKKTQKRKSSTSIEVRPSTHTYARIVRS